MPEVNSKAFGRSSTWQLCAVSASKYTRLRGNKETRHFIDKEESQSQESVSTFSRIAQHI